MPIIVLNEVDIPIITAIDSANLTNLQTAKTQLISNLAIARSALDAAVSHFEFTKKQVTIMKNMLEVQPVATTDLTG